MDNYRDVPGNGIGIDPAQKEQLFHPFVRLQTARQLSAEDLGLTTVKKSSSDTVARSS